MKTTIKLLLTMSVFLTFALTSCTPEDGADGLMGPQGSAGINGTNGADGNANVTSILFEDQSIVIGLNEYNVPQLTQAIFDNGLVYGYVTINSSSNWEVLPISSGGSIILEIDMIEVGKILLKSTFVQSNLKIRFVLAEASTIIISGIDFSNYKEVENYFDL